MTPTTQEFGLKPCEACSMPMERKTWSNGEPENEAQYARRKTCDRACASALRRYRVSTRTEKRCPRCGEIKSIEAFRPHRDRPDRRHGLCRPCENAYEREWRKTEKGRALRQRLERRWKYGIEQGEYDALLLSQQGVCAICRKPEHVSRDGKVKPLCVDHNHETGRVRGLLCQGCNQGIGNFQEDANALFNAARYLELA